MHISVITTCKNRLQHLQATLPLLVGMPDTEVIVVDYGCDEGSGAWAKAQYGAVTVVDVADDPVFNLARARNIGAKAASAAILCFVDADTFMLADISKWVLENFRPNGFYVIERARRDLDGFLLCRREDFERVGGYDEAFRGWGFEDTDLQERLEAVGLERRFIPHNLFSTIEHADSLRQFGPAHDGFRDLPEALALGHLYCVIKRDLRRLSGREPDFDFRRSLMEQIKTLNRTAETRNMTTFTISIDAGVVSLRASPASLARKIDYVFQRFADGEGDGPKFP